MMRPAISGRSTTDSKAIKVPTADTSLSTLPILTGWALTGRPLGGPDGPAAAGAGAPGLAGSAGLPESPGLLDAAGLAESADLLGADAGSSFLAHPERQATM